MLAAMYRRLLPPSVPQLPAGEKGGTVFHLFPIRVAERDTMRTYLEQRGIQTGVHYWPTVDRQPALQAPDARAAELKRALAWSEEVLTLPMFAELSEEELRIVAAAIGEILEAEEW
jgi:dTDP-4-amino-4,6-dideoxygalactose transaminase